MARKRFSILSDRPILWIQEATCQNIGHFEVDHMRAEADFHWGSVDVVAVARDLTSSTIGMMPDRVTS